VRIAGSKIAPGPVCRRTGTYPGDLATHAAVNVGGELPHRVGRSGRSPDRPLDLLLSVQLICALLHGAGDTTGRTMFTRRRTTVGPAGQTTELLTVLAMSSPVIGVRTGGWDIRGCWFGVVAGTTPRLGELRRGQTIPGA
jgi:hypothetical protein